MTTPADADQGPSALPTAAVVRWLCLAALLAAEVLLLTTRFHAGAFAGGAGGWGDWLRQAPALLRLAVVVVAATLLIAGRRWLEEFRRASLPLLGGYRWWPFLLGHVGAFAAFALLTAAVLGGLFEVAPYPAAGILLWWLVGWLTLILWGLAALPARLWLRLARRGAGGLLAGLALGAVGWAAAPLVGRLWLPLGRATLWAVHALLGLVYPDVVCRPEEFLVGTASFAVEIAPECSGYEGIGLVWLFLGAYLWAFRDRVRFPHALLLFPLGTAAIWCANAVRIAGLIAIGTAGWPEVTYRGFHSQAGWLAFNAVALGLVAAGGRLRLFARHAPASRREHAGNPAAPYLVPLLVLLAFAMAGAALSGGLDWLYPLRVLAVLAAAWLCRSPAVLRGWSWSWEPVGLGILAFLLWAGFGTAGGPPAAWQGLPALWAGVWLTFRVLGHVATAPLAEELAFRGYLTRRLIAADFWEVPPGRFTWASFLISSLAFGLLHGRHWLPGTMAGMVFALALYRRGRVGDAIIAHATANALTAGAVLLTGNWALWS